MGSERELEEHIEEIAEWERYQQHQRDEAMRAEGAAAERDAIVAWLRSTPGERGCPWTDAANEIADALERGARLDDEKGCVAKLRADLGEAVAVMKAFLSSYHRVESATDSFPAPFRLHGTTATREAYETMGALLARIEGRKEG